MITEQCLCDLCNSEVEIENSKVDEWKYTTAQFGFQFRVGGKDIMSLEHICVKCGETIYEALNKILKELLKK